MSVREPAVAAVTSVGAAPDTISRESEALASALSGVRRRTATTAIAPQTKMLIARRDILPAIGVR
ncbi:MAG: hypothetical protein ACKVW3_00625 [Phycisphaerales bacterium]